MKQIIVLITILFTTSSAASDRLVLSESGYDTERGIVAHLYADDLADAKTMTIAGRRSEPTIAIATIDLNHDSQPEIVAQIVHPFFCGSHGCTLLILAKQDNGEWKEIAGFISYGGVEVHDEFKNNYRTISLDHANTRFVFNNGEYQ